mmetsp:Transcript_20079/g.28455  ORF Transcript_20079/g.28455 Transcript_20079/m.28455 type:complete len:526 (-) Transcript_20079:178-1755(-)
MKQSETMSNVTSCNSSSPTKKKKLIVIGAGMAGIKLSHTLLTKQQQEQEQQNSGSTNMNITILDANGYVGGRVRNMKVFATHDDETVGSDAGYTVELGANWISGLELTYDNPIWKLAKEVSLKGHLCDHADAAAIQALDSHGNDITDEYMEAVEKFEDICEKAIKTCSGQGITAQTDVGVQSFLHELGWGKDEPLRPVEKLVEYNVLEVAISDGLEQLSTAHNWKEGANDIELGQEEFFVEDQRGFNSIMNGMVNDINNYEDASLQLNTQVERVEYALEATESSSSPAVKVTARNLDDGSITEYFADAVVSTVSIGVLKEEKIKFIPPFPEWKVKALNEIDMYVLAKVYVKFQKDFRIKPDEVIFCTGRKGYYPLWRKYRSTSQDQNYFMCLLGGSEAKRVESLTKDQIKDEVEELFRNAFQKNTTLADGPGSSLFRPLDVAVTDWSRNPRFCGSYACLPLNAYAHVPYDDLARGLTGAPNQQNEGDPVTLHFAGEGFDDKFNGWVQGAYRSGERVAQVILDSRP